MFLCFFSSPADGDSAAVEKSAHHLEPVLKLPSPSTHLLKPTVPASAHTPAAKHTLPAVHTGLKATPSSNHKSTTSSHPELHLSQEHLPRSPLSSSSTSTSELSTNIETFYVSQLILVDVFSTNSTTGTESFKDVVVDLQLVLYSI